MVPIALSSASVWTATDLVTRLGAIPLDRVRTNPPPGLATERDVIEIHDRENRLCELLDGSLLEKTMGSYESYLAVLICQVLVEFVQKRDLGIVLGADGMLRLAPGLVRIPDVSFIAWERLPGRVFPREEIWFSPRIWPSKSSAGAIRARKWTANSAITLRPACVRFGTCIRPRGRCECMTALRRTRLGPPNRHSKAAIFCPASASHWQRFFPRPAGAVKVHF